MDATYIDIYSCQLLTNLSVVEAAGLQNDLTGAVPPMTRVNAKLGIGGSRERHSAKLTGRYIDKVVSKANKLGFQARFPFSTTAKSI